MPTFGSDTVSQPERSVETNLDTAGTNACATVETTVCGEAALYNLFRAAGS
jgi:hypothetical protein